MYLVTHQVLSTMMAVLYLSPLFLLLFPQLSSSFSRSRSQLKRPRENRYFQLHVTQTPISPTPLHRTKLFPQNHDLGFFAKDSLLVGGFVSCCLLFSCAFITWEDHAGTYLWPNRHRTMLWSQNNMPWGSTTVRGLGFGASERETLDKLSGETSTTLLSYNELMLAHRNQNVQMWRQPASPSDFKTSIHTVVASLQQVWSIQDDISTYEWEDLRSELRSPPLSQLPEASATLRKMHDAALRDTVGFDWGSCAWRHCGALADTQESLDEIDYLLGVLEPFEITFCLDIVERSLRDILATIPWYLASDTDRQFYLTIPDYVSKVARHAESLSEGALSQVDGNYLQILQELRID